MGIELGPPCQGPKIGTPTFHRSEKLMNASMRAMPDHVIVLLQLLMGSLAFFYRRQDFEYLLKRRRGLKEDYLRYIDYETKLEALRQHRKDLLLKQLQVWFISYCFSFAAVGVFSLLVK